MRSATALLILLFLGMSAARAGECRATVRPLLLATAPDPAALAAARDLCRAEADAGDADAGYQLALFHLGLGGEWQPQAAIPLIHTAAIAGVPEAQYWLAWQQESGPLLPHDEAAARDWYLRAAAADHRLANARLAQAYAAGELGLAVDARKAAEYRAREARCLLREQAGER